MRIGQHFQIPDEEFEIAIPDMPLLLPLVDVIQLGRTLEVLIGAAREVNFPGS
jgi:hypothetical protein